MNTANVLEPGPVPAAVAATGGKAAKRLIADRYLLREVLTGAFRGLVWFAGLFLMFAIVTQAKTIREEHLPFLLVVRIVWLEFPRILLFTIPASLLYGTVQAFVEMSARGEITALNAGGMSLLRMLVGPLSVALVATGITFYVQEVWVPYSQLAKSDMKLDAVRQIGKQLGFTYADYRGDGGFSRILQAQSFDPVTHVFLRPAIQVFRENNSLQYEVFADRADWNPSDSTWVLTSHVRVITAPDPDAPMDPSGNQTMTSSTSCNSWTIKGDVIQDPGTLEVESYGMGEQLKDQNYEMVSMRDLVVYRNHLISNMAAATGRDRHELKKRIASATYGIHDKIDTPFLCLALVLIAVPLGIQQRRTANPGLALGLSMLVLVVYYMTETLTTQLGKGGGLPPLVAAYLPLALMTGLGLELVRRKS